MKTNDAPLISVIVPVYNIEDYIERCLNSLQVQTMKNIEIIAIDDGSTDNSGKICDMFAEKDSRFKVIHKNNEGVSAARNDGLDVSKGKYIMFVDGDDWVEPTFCEVPYHTIKDSNADVVIFSWAYHKKHDKKTTVWNNTVPYNGFINKKELFVQQYDSISVVAWNKLYKKRLFEKARFPYGRVSEDNALTHYLIYYAKSVFLLDVILYHNFGYRPNSITTKRSFTFQYDEAYFFFLRRNDLFRWGLIEIEGVVEAAVFYLIKIGRNAELSNMCISIIKNFNPLKSNSISIKRKLMIITYKISPLLFDLVCNVSGKRVHKFSIQ